MSTEITKQPNEQQVAIESQKRQSWGTMGVLIYRQELELQVRAQASLSKLENPPNSIEEVQASEEALREVKADLVKLTDDRKKITCQFDAVAQRLMAPEKSFSTPITDFANAIIKVKKDHQQKEAQKQLKASELTRIRQQLSIHLSQIDAEYKTLIASKVNEAYTFALTKNNAPAEIDDYKDRVAFRITEKLFTPERPNPSRQYATLEEVNEIIENVFVVKPSDYVALFAVELEKRFQDYEIAFNNKKQALELAQTEQAAQLQEIQQEQQNATVAATLEASSTELTIEQDFKPLKKCFEVDMVECFESAMKILSAFMANKSKCLDKTTTKKWFAFSADSAAKALAKVKSDDNAFAPAGIIFKEVDKL